MNAHLKNNYTGEIRLGSSHSVILGNKPDVITFKHICDKVANERKSTMNFGLFDNATANYATYYPELNIEDLTPKEGEFIYPVFRALSASIVSKYFPIDFSMNGVLKKNMNKLVGQTINIDHETMIANAIGSVKEVFWQESYKTAEGKTIPAGINMVMMIDGKSNPRIARGIMMDPPSIHSNSVGIRFKWEPSHEFDEKDDFWSKVGGYTKDGELIRAVVTDIIAFVETSLVAHGADVFAQKIGDDGKIVNPDYAHSNYQFSKKEGKAKGIIHINYKDPETFDMVELNKTIPDELNTSETFNKEENNNNNNVNMKITKEELKDLASSFKLKEEDLNEENFIDKVKKKFSEVESENETLKAEKDDDGVELTEEELTSLRSKEVIADSALSETRKEALRLYKLCKGEDAQDANIVKLINSADYNTANSFLKEYEKEANNKFQATCSCGKTIKLGSSIGSDENLIDDEGNPIKTGKGNQIGEKTFNDTLTKFKNKRNKSRLFKNEESKN